MNEDNISYGMVSRYQQHNQIAMQMLYAAYKAGDTQLADKISKSLRKDMEQQVSYYQSLPDRMKTDAINQEEARNANLLRGLMSMDQQFKNQPKTELPNQIQTAPVQPADTP